MTKINYTIKPKALRKNSQIALIAPAGPITESQLVAAQENLSEMGFKSSFTEKILARKGYLAGDDQTRLDDLHQAFENDDIDAILCIRGGYGSSRILKNIDYNLIKQHPKIFIGYSDITALLHSIWQQTGLITFHGVVGISHFSEYTKRQFLSMFLNQSANQEIDTCDTESIEVIVHGECEGQLMGGNLSIINSLIGTPFELDFENKLLFIEEVNEAPYKIDRMLTQLLLASKIETASGIILGKFNGCDIDNDEITAKNSLSLKDVFADRLGHLQMPVISGFSFGHVEDQTIFPIGINASVDTADPKIRLLESAFA